MLWNLDFVSKSFCCFSRRSSVFLFSFTTITDKPVGIKIARISLVLLVTDGTIKNFLKTKKKKQKTETQKNCFID